MLRRRISMRTILALGLACIASSAIAQDLYYYGEPSPVIVSNYGRPLLVTSYPTYPQAVTFYNWPPALPYAETVSYAYALPANTVPLQIAGTNAIAYWPAGYLPQVTYRAPPSLPVLDTPVVRTAEAAESSTLR
jgi:hypothetical protein